MIPISGQCCAASDLAVSGRYAPKNTPTEHAENFYSG